MIAAATVDGSPSQTSELKVTRELGRGAMSVVYEAVREGRKFALKVLQDSGDVEAESLRRRAFRESVILARLDHPGLVKVVEAGELRGKPYMLLEFVEGEELSNHVRRGPMAPDVVVTIAKTIAGALGAVHGHGLVHRDVKPANILITPSGRPKLIDFGLAAEATAELTGSRNQEVVGTFTYASPEQAGLLKRPVDGRADLYSLGVIMYECLSGRPPFVAEDLGELLRQHAAVVPPRLHEIGVDVNPLLSAIVARLLAKDPDDRYQSAEGLIADLERMEELEAEFLEFGEVVLGRNDAARPRTHSSPFVGRPRELERMGALWKEAVTRRGVVLTVQGEVGIGKTRLCEEFAGVVSDAGPGRVVLRTRGSRASRVPYGAIRHALDSHIQRVVEAAGRGDSGSREVLDRAIGEIGPLLRGLSPLMASVVPDEGDVTVEGEQFNDALARFVTSLAKESGGLLFVVDDAQWLDEGSLEVLTRIAANVESVPLFLVLASRSPGVPGEEVDAVAALETFPSCHRIDLAPLDVPGVGDLIQGLLGGHSVARPFVERLAASTNGNPLAVEEYVRVAVDRGLILPAPGEWRVDMDGFASLDLPSDVLELSLRRVDTLDEASRLVLKQAALIGRTFSPRLLVEVVDQDEDVVNRAISEAVRANLIARTGADSYQFLQDRVWETLGNSIDEEVRREIHQRIAEVMDTNGFEAPEQVFVVARHYALGKWERYPERVYETNLAAGQLALSQYGYKEAYGFLETAREVLGTPSGRHLQGERGTLEQALGKAARGIGRNQMAIAHFRRSLEHIRDPLARARLHADIGAVHVDEVDLRAAWKSCMLALDCLGKPYPRSMIRQVFGALFSWVLATVLRRLNIGHGSSSGARREKHKLLCHVYRLAGEVRYYSFQPVSMLLLTLRQLLYAHLLGPCPESVNTLSWFGVVMANLKRRSMAEFYGDRAMALARELGDKAVLQTARMWSAFAAHFLGDMKRGEVMWAETLPDIDTWLHPRDYAKCVSDYCINLMVRGYMKEALGLAKQGMRKADQAHLTVSSVMMRAYAAAILSALGRTREATHYHYEALDLAETLPEGERWGRIIMLTYLAFGMVERGDVGSGIEELFDTWESYAIPPEHVPAHPRPMFVFIAYARLQQFRLATDEGRAEALERVNRALRQLKMVEKLDYNDCHWFIIQAALCRASGDVKSCERLLGRAEALAERADSEWGRYEVALERARLAKSMGDEMGAQASLKRALSIAEGHGWRGRLNRLESEFDIVHEQVVGTVTTFPPAQRTRGTRTQLGETTSAGVTTLRYLDALLRVSTASASSLDPGERARAALDELIKVLGAERGFLFLDHDGTHAAAACARDAQSQDIGGENTYSTTVVERVRRTRKAMVMVGDEDHELSMAESVVANGLKSIVAAPLMMDDRCLGVVYLDSSLARGLFTEEDLDILTALANHIAIALETGRLVQVELERKAMEKDLALTSAVQSFFLPREPFASRDGILVHGFYRPAAQCSGDWWWYDLQEDRVVVFVGDVTGHGAASAMLTASAATHYRAIMRKNPGTDLPQLLQDLNMDFVAICNGAYNMTMSALEIETGSRTLRWYNAGGPAILILTNTGKVLSLSSAGTALGNLPFSLGRQERRLEPGDRVFVYTDGLPEMVLPNGRQLGIRRLSKQFAATRGLPIEEAVGSMVEALDRARGDTPLDDDLTFLLVDITG